MVSLLLPLTRPKGPARTSHRKPAALAIEWLCDDRGVPHLFMDALDGIGIGVCGDEDDRYVAYLAKPSSGLYAFAASFEINVHQDDIGRILHCLQKGVLSVCR